MRTLAGWCLASVTCAFLLMQHNASGEDQPKSNPVLDHVYAKLQPLLEKYFPKAKCTNQGRDGLHFEHDVTTFEFPYEERKAKKHEATTQRGPKKGGILCSVYLEKGSYFGQLKLFPRGKGQHEPLVLDKQAYKQLLMAPYSAKNNVHLQVSLKYPADTNPDFLKEFRAFMANFEQDLD